ncbi:hypothetical protein N0V82_002137 [Gnomoniopsis sp. IMI 355080]|nr:hypothetical protein N0V82_002137 [Gnomoniopsis sp. IMI 355080]
MPTLTDLIGAADNLGEPVPALNRKPAILGIVISFQLLTWICVLFRLYTRFFIIKMPWWDDLFVVLSSISTTVGGTAVMVLTGTGMGKHLVLLSPGEFNGYLRGFYVANASYPCSAAFIKLALLFQYLRIFPRGAKLWIVSLGLIIFTSLWGLVYGVLAWFPTSPVEAYWHLDQPAARYAYGSVDVEMFVTTYETHAALNMLLDAVVLSVAVPLFFKPGLRKNSYWGLLGLFVLGGIVNMLSIWRLQSIVETRATTLPTFDPTWYGPTPIVLSSMEVCLATICASLPVFWPVLKKNLGPYIMVTHEIRVTRESRFANDLEDNVELHQSRTELSEDPLHLPSMSEGDKDSNPYRDSFKKTQQEQMFGRLTSVRVKCESGNQDKDVSLA